MKVIRIEQRVWDARLPDFGVRQYRATFKLRGNMHHYVFVMAVDEIQAYKLAMPEMLKYELKDVLRQFAEYKKEKQPVSMLGASKAFQKLDKKRQEVMEQLEQWQQT
jgi:hypothetical protein